MMDWLINIGLFLVFASAFCFFLSTLIDKIVISHEQYKEINKLKAQIGLQRVRFENTLKDISLDSKMEYARGIEKGKESMSYRLKELEDDLIAVSKKYDEESAKQYNVGWNAAINKIRDIYWEQNGNVTLSEIKALHRSVN